MRKLGMLIFIFSLHKIAHAQGVVLHAGDSWTYQFTSLDYIGLQAGYPDTFGAQFSFGYSILSYPPNVNYECFEGLPPDGSLGFGSQPIGGNGIFLPVNAWQDLEGSVNFTVTSGSFLINSLTFTVWHPDAINPSMFDVYQTTVTPTPTPEPGTLALLASGCVFFSLLPRIRHDRASVEDI